MLQKESITKMGITPFTIKNYYPDDLDNYARLLEEIEAHDQAGRYSSKQSLVEDLGHPRFLPETSLFLAGQDGDLIGYFSVFQEPEIGRALLDTAVHPSRRRKGIGTKLFDGAVRQAGRAGLDVAQICISEHNKAAQKMMSGLEMKYIRDHIGFQLDLTAIKIPAVTSGDYIIRHLRPGEEYQLTALQNLAFSGAWGFNPNTTEEIVYRVHLSSCTPEDILMAFQGEQPVGYCWTRIQVDEISTPNTRTGEIHMIGVDPDFRQKGLGRNMLLSGLHHLKGKGLAKVELTADGEDPVPRGLYESVGFKETTKMRWYEKRLT
jgi:mycothiol synthase